MFQSWDAMWYHVSNYHVRGIKKSFECHLCKKTSVYFIISNQRIHMNSLHVGDKCFKCPFSNCSKEFSHKGNMKTHINAVHTKKITFKCTKCSYKSYYKKEISAHVARYH